MLSYNKDNNEIYQVDYLIGKKVLCVQDGFDLCGQIITVHASGTTTVNATLYSEEQRKHIRVPRNMFIKIQFLTREIFPEMFL